MASINMYPPVVDTSVPAFVASGDGAYCRLYFSLSKFSSISTIQSIHVSVVKQSSGQSVIRRIDNPDAGRFRATGILIVNTKPIAVEGADNLFYIDILNEDIVSGDKIGWYAGWIYKIQLRFSTVQYTGIVGQSNWLNINSGNFSEWSTYCTTKAIGQPRITIPVLKNFDSNVNGNSTNADKTYSFSSSTLDLNGSYSNEDKSETLYSYQLRLFRDEELIEESDILYTNQYYSPNQFKYLFKHELDDCTYILQLSYTTINKFTETFIFNLEVAKPIIDEIVISAVTIDTVDGISSDEFRAAVKDATSLEKEKDDGRIGIKLYSDYIEGYNGNICLRRADSRDNYKIWTDIKIIPCVNTAINQLDMIFDNTVESGVWYKYGVQIIDTNGERGILYANEVSVLREFNYAYLIGEGGRQLRLSFNNTMNSYTYNYSEGKTDTIGGQYPFISRNGNMKYRTIPVNGLISFNMDENELFTTDKELYKFSNVIDSYKARRREEHLGMYDYKREFDFREKVLAFLQDGKPKLFKSATEGNMIIRLMQVAAQPIQSLNRMLYSFTATGHEVAEASMENYLKYGYYEVGEWLTSFEYNTIRLGQLDMDFSVGDNIIEKIWEKYDSSSQNIAGKRITLKNVHHLKLEFTDKPLRVINSGGDIVMGNNIKYGSSLITIGANYTRVYVFDENIIFSEGSSILVEGEYTKKGATSPIETVHITVDFLYEVGEEPYKEKEIDVRVTEKGIGQMFNNYTPGSDLYNELYYKFYYEWAYEFRRLAQVTWTCIEAVPGAVFQIQDLADSATKISYHDIGWTGLLNLEGLGVIQGLKYIGMRRPDGSIDTSARCDVMVDYIYYVSKGTYKEE